MRAREQVWKKFKTPGKDQTAARAPAQASQTLYKNEMSPNDSLCKSLTHYHFKIMNHFMTQRYYFKNLHGLSGSN